MEFHEKLQELRKKKGLTQEQLAQELYVSRTAISKWESGRGMPSIDSLRAIAKFFSVTVDDLLSGDGVLALAEEENQKKMALTRDLVFGLLDCAAILLLFLPLFGQETAHGVQAVPLLAMLAWWRVPCACLVCAMAAMGVLLLALQNWDHPLWIRLKGILSLGLNLLMTLLLIFSRQPYGATFLVMILTIKVFLLLKKP